MEDETALLEEVQQAGKEFETAARLVAVIQTLAGSVSELGARVATLEAPLVAQQRGIQTIDEAVVKLGQLFKKLVEPKPRRAGGVN